MAFTPLTEQQYNKAIAAGFSPDQIIANEQQRKQTSSPLSVPGVAKGIVKGAISFLQGADALGAMNKMAGAPGDFTGMTWKQRTDAVAPKTRDESVGSELSTIASLAVPTDIAASKGAQVAGNILEGTGEKVSKMFIPTSSKEAKFLQSYKAVKTPLERFASLFKGSDVNAPVTAADTAFSKGLMGPESWIGVQAKRAQGKLWDNIISPALKQSETRVQMDDFFSQSQQKIVQDNPDPTRRGTLLNALSSIKEDFGQIKNISLEQLQKYKEGWAKFVPERAYKGENISASLNDVRDTLADVAREHIYNSLGDNVKQAYIDYGNMNALMELGQKAMTGAIKGGTGTSLKNLWEMATVPVGTVAGQTIYKVGQVVKLLGSSGALTLGALLSRSAPSTTAPTSQAQSSPAPTLAPPTSPASVQNPQPIQTTTVPPIQ